VTWRGEVTLSDGPAAERENIVRKKAADALGLPASSLAVAIGPVRDGRASAAAVSVAILTEARDFLTRSGYSPAAIAAADGLPAFPHNTRRRLSLPSFQLRPPLTRALAGGLAASAAVWLFALSGDATDPRPVLQTPSATAPIVAEAAPAEFIAAPPARPADFVPRQFVPERTFAAAPERPAPAVVSPPAPAVVPPPAPTAVPSQAATGPVTMASRSVASLPDQPARMLTPEPDRSVFRLATLEAARDRVAATLKSAPLVLGKAQPAIPTSDRLPRVAELRPVERPVTDAQSRTIPQTVSTAAASVSESARPRPRPGGTTTAALSAAITDAVATAAAEPARVAATAATTALVAAPRPAPRRIAAVAFQQPKPTFSAQAPTVSRGTVPAPKPTVQAAPAPVRQVAVATPAPAPAPAIPRAAPARAAPQSVGLQRNEVSLVGVFGSPSNRRAILRLPNGKMTKVEAGDRVDGARVAAVGPDSVRLSGRSQDIVLKLP
jgi:type IV pilus biogenesis protein PilP